MTLPSPYPVIRTCDPPAFLEVRYRNMDGFLAEVRRRAEGTLPDFDADRVKRTFPTIPELFQATEQRLEAAFAGDAAASRYRILVQRLLLWQEPNEVRAALSGMFDRVIQDMPQHLRDIEESGGGRDVLDPFIVAFAGPLLGDGLEVIELLAAHKCLMKLEDLIGHVHQQALGMAAGGEVVAEPLGETDETGQKNKEEWHETLNPFPGADARRGTDEFYQIKNKTGSAKGSDGEKLGRQFRVLAEKYPESQRFYVSMVGRTLSGHRSMGAFLRTDPDAEVLVGLAAFQQLGHHRDTADIVMELYREVFNEALQRNHYNFKEVIARISVEWVEKHGSDDPALAILRDTITPTIQGAQSSKTYGASKRQRAKRR